MAVTLTAGELQTAIGSDAATATRLLAVASERVARYAPDAPAAMQNEAAIRFGAYLADAGPATVASSAAGPFSDTYVVNHADAFRRSGAAGLLAPWRTLAGLIVRNGTVE